MKIVPCLVVACSLVVASGVASLGEELSWSASFRKLIDERTGRYAATDGTTISRVKNGKRRAVRVHEAGAPATFVFGSFAAAGFSRGQGGGFPGPSDWKLNSFTGDPNGNGDSVWGLTIWRSTLYYDGLLLIERNDAPKTDDGAAKSGNKHRPSCQVETALGRVDEGEVFRMPDNTEWKAVAMEVPKGNMGRVVFRVKAVPGTQDAGLKGSQNSTLFLPLNSTVRLSVASAARRDSHTVNCKLEARIRDASITLLTEGFYRLNGRKRAAVYGKKENPGIKAGQIIELLPGRWCKVRKVVKPDPKKKIRGWIEFDTRPVAVKKPKS